MWKNILQSQIEEGFLSTSITEIIIGKNIQFYPAKLKGRSGEGHEKEWNLTICDSMDGPRGYYAKWNKSVRERQKYHIISLTCGI